MEAKQLAPAKFVSFSQLLDHVLSNTPRFASDLKPCKEVSGSLGSNGNNREEHVGSVDWSAQVPPLRRLDKVGEEAVFTVPSQS